MENKKKQKALRKNARLISTTQAAELAGVSTVTIQNLCRGGYLSYSLKGKMYMVSKFDVEKYIDSIHEINEATNDIEEYKQLLKEKAAEMKTEVEILEKRKKTLLEDLKLQPERIKAMSEFCCAVMESHGEGSQYNLNTRYYYVVRYILQGRKLEEIAAMSNLSVDKVKSIWHTALRVIATAKNKVDYLTVQVEDLKQIIEDKNREIMELRSIHPEHLDEWKKRQNLLDRYLYMEDLSVRTLKCLEKAKIVTVRDLVQTYPRDLLRYRNFGQKSLTELCEFLERRGLYFGIDLDNFVDV